MRVRHTSATRSATRLAVAVLALATLMPTAGGCAGAAASTQAATTPVAERAIPDEPLALIPGDAQFVLRADLRALRAWSAYSRLVELATRAECDTVPELLALVDQVDLVALAVLARPESPTAMQADPTSQPSQPSQPGQPTEPDPDGLVVVRGRLGELDLAHFMTEAEHALAEATAVGQAPTPIAGTSPTIRTEGRFQWFEGARFSAVRLDPHTVVAGTPRAVARAVALARGNATGPAFVESGWVQRMALTERALGLVGQVEPGLADEVTEAGGELLGRELATALAQSSEGLSLDVSDGLRAELQLELPSPALASDVLSQSSRALGQAEMFLRMFRLPPLAQRLDLRVEDRTFLASLALPAEEVQQLVQLAESAAQLPACPAQPVQAMPPQSATTDAAAPAP